MLGFTVAKFLGAVNIVIPLVVFDEDSSFVVIFEEQRMHFIDWMQRSRE